MKCTSHSREIETGCNWCGKKMCQKCIPRIYNRKTYCDKCYITISNIPQDKQPQQLFKNGVLVAEEQ